MIIVTGGAGFIGSTIIWELNRRGFDDILAVDHLSHSEKWRNIRGLHIADYLEKDRFRALLLEDSFAKGEIEAVFHLGACSSTSEMNCSYLIENNYQYSKEIASFCLERDIRLIYASSAATYGDGTFGYDDEKPIKDLRPLNMYGMSKHLFDLWAYREGVLRRAVGLKFSNVYGPNENHKGSMRSVINKAFDQIHDQGKISLFMSHRSDYEDGEQKRDFLYSKDAAKIAVFFFERPDIHGLFNVGTGIARSWNDLAQSVFIALDRDVQIEYIEMPEAIRDTYQYYTKLTTAKLHSYGYNESYFSLEEGINDYVKYYLAKKHYLADRPQAVDFSQ